MTAIDHLVFAAPDLSEGIRIISRQLGAEPAPGGAHPQWGTRNALLSLGPATYLEVIGPDPEASTEGLPAAFQIDRIDRPRLVTWAARSNDLEGAVEHAARQGLRLGAVAGGQRQRPDGSRLSWRLTDPLTVTGDGLVPFLIDWGETENPALSAPTGGSLLELRAEHPHPELIRRMLDILELDLTVSPGKTPRLIATIRTPGGAVELH